MSSTANVYNLHNTQLHVSYSTGALGSKAGLVYQDAHQTLNFDEQQMRRVPTDLGEEVSVTIHITVDAGSTTFTLVVPKVAVELNQQTHVETIGITALHRFSINPGLLHGQIDTYSVAKLRGSGSAHVF
jgi:hypothetical protein